MRLRQARLDTRLSEFELRGFTESLVADVERTCWDYALARRQIEIVEESLKVSRQQRDETRELIAVGRLAEAELPAVQAEVAAQEQDLIEARAYEETIRLQLLRLLNPSGPDIWGREVILIPPGDPAGHSVGKGDPLCGRGPAHASDFERSPAAGAARRPGTRQNPATACCP